MELAVFDLSCAVCGKQPSGAQSWGRVLPGADGNKDQPIGTACADCLEVAEARWPQSRWEDLIENPEYRSRINSLAALRCGEKAADFIPKNVESKLKTSIRWIDVLTWKSH